MELLTGTAIFLSLSLDVTIAARALGPGGGSLRAGPGQCGVTVGPGWCAALTGLVTMAASTSQLLPTTAMEESASGNQETPRRRRNLVIRRRPTVSGFPQPVFKIIFIGDQCTGKSSLVQRYAYDRFPDQNQCTIGAEYASRTIGWTINTTIRLHLWDISGQDRFSTLTRPFYRHADAAFVVFDASRPETFHNARRWKENLDEKVRLPCGARIPCVLLANKCDLPVKMACVEDEAFMDAWTARYGFHGWSETSAKEDIGIEAAVECLILELMEEPVHRRVDQLGERRLALRDDDELCACMNEGLEQPVWRASTRDHPERIMLLQAQAALSRCPCW